MQQKSVSKANIILYLRDQHNDILQGQTVDSSVFTFSRNLATICLSVEVKSPLFLLSLLLGGCSVLDRAHSLNMVEEGGRQAVGREVGGVPVGGGMEDREVGVAPGPGGTDAEGTSFVDDSGVFKLFLALLLAGVNVNISFKDDTFPLVLISSNGAVSSFFASTVSYSRFVSLDLEFSFFKSFSKISLTPWTASLSVFTCE